MIPLFVVDEVETVVNLVNDSILSTIKQNEVAALGSTNIERVNFEKGGYLELLETLAQKDQSNSTKKFKYPLVYLQQPFKETRGQANIYTETYLRILFIHQTEQGYKTTDRYRNVIKPVLSPIYLEFLRQAEIYSGIVGSYFEHDYTELPFGGSISSGVKDGIMLNDFVDAIDVTNLNLKFYNKTC